MNQLNRSAVATVVSICGAMGTLLSCAESHEGAGELSEVQQHIYWNDDVTSWYDTNGAVPLQTKNTLEVCWNGVFEWDYVDPAPYGSCEEDADCTGDDYCVSNAACLAEDTCQCDSPWNGAWNYDPSALATAKAYAVEAIEEQWGDNTGLVFNWHDTCAGMSQDWVPIRLVEVSQLGHMGGVAQYGVGGRVGTPKHFGPNVPEAQIEMGFAAGVAYNEAQFKSVAVHEMGHALAAIHEHARPDAVNSCDVGGEFTDTGIYATEPYDPDSIMNYCRDVDDDGNPDGYTPAVSEDATATDIAGMQAIYGFPQSWTDPNRNFCSGPFDRFLVGDVNGDGRSDLICYDRQYGILSVDLADEAGTFTSTDWSAPRQFCQNVDDELQILDLNGDGSGDILCREYQTGYLKATFGAADGSFPEVTWYGPFADWCPQPSKLRAGSFDGDERDDLVCLSLNGQLSVQYSALPVFPEPEEEEEGCTEATATDMGADGNGVTVPNDTCLMVRDGYPGWWGVRTMQLQPEALNGVSVPFAWSNTCSAGSGSGTFTTNWVSQNIYNVSDDCATLIELQGSGAEDITLRYYGL